MNNHNNSAKKNTKAERKMIAIQMAMNRGKHLDAYVYIYIYIYTILIILIVRPENSLRKLSQSSYAQ